MKTPQPGWASLWRHYFHRERTASELTESMRSWQQRWNWDFVKINPPACYHALDWGADYQFYPDPFREPTLVSPAIRTVTDLETIVPPAPDRGMLAEQLQTIRNLRSDLGPEIPMVHTVFSPIEIAHRMMTGRPMLIEFLRSSPDALSGLLRKITNVFREFCLRCLDAGADGVFFATKWASSQYLTWAEYERFGKPYEEEILSELRRRKAWVILHVCGDHTYLDRMLDYQMDVLSYDFYSEGAMDPEVASAESGKFVLGGLDPETLQEDPDGTLRRMERYMRLECWMAGPSCVVPPRVTDESIQRFKDRISR